MIKKTSSAPQEILICRANHPLKSIFFCKRCAQDFAQINPILERVFFCRECNPAAIKQHSHLTDRYSISQSNFIDAYIDFKKSVQLYNKMAFARCLEKPNARKPYQGKDKPAIINLIITKNPPIFRNALKNDEKTLLEDLNHYEYRKWLVSHHFWAVPYINSVNQIDSYVQSQFVEQKVDPWSNFELDFNKNAAAIDLSKEIQESKNRLADLRRQKTLSELFVQITTCFSTQDIEKTLAQFTVHEKQLKDKYQFLLKLGRLRVLQLHDDSSNKMKNILKMMNSESLKPRQKQLYYYYSAISQWSQVNDPDEEVDQIFLDSRNKKYFKLKQPKNYINFLTRAINIEARPIYRAARGLGYLANKQYEKAETDFEMAKRQSYQSDAMENNRLLSLIKRNIEAQKFINKQEIQFKKNQYIINLCKFLEKQKKYSELKKCCELLVDREPRNVAFKISYLNVLLKLKDTDSSRSVLSAIKDMRELSNDEIEEFQKKIQLLRAYQQDEIGNLSDAQGKFEHAAKIGQPSASYWYNYASFLFKHKDDRERNEKALIAINNALQIKQKPAYYELKYLLLVTMGNLQEASVIQQYITGSKYESMKEYVNANL